MSRFPRAGGEGRRRAARGLAGAGRRRRVRGLPGAGFVLAVGTLEPRKNLPRLAAAYAALPARGSGAPPARRRRRARLAGRRDALAALDALGPSAMRLGHVSDAALAELYRRCAVFCYPSLGEGFGLPVLEAMAAGAAVLTSIAQLAARGRRRRGRVLRPAGGRRASPRRCRRCSMIRRARAELGAARRRRGRRSSRWERTAGDRARGARAGGRHGDARERRHPDVQPRRRGCAARRSPCSRQTHGEIELVISDNASSDGDRGAVRRAAASAIRACATCARRSTAARPRTSTCSTRRVARRVRDDALRRRLAGADLRRALPRGA